MKALLANLSPRDRRILLAGGTAAVFLVLLFTWLSLHGRVERLQSVVSDQKALDQWMQKTASEVVQLRGAQTKGPDKTGGRSLLAIVDQTAKQAGLGGAIKRVEPEKENGVRIWFEQVAFDDMVRWLSSLRQSYAVQINTITVDRQPQAGIVDARIVLKGAG